MEIIFIQNTLSFRLLNCLKIACLLSTILFLTQIPHSGASESSNKTDLKRTAFHMNIMPPVLLPQNNVTIFELVLLNKLEEDILKIRSESKIDSSDISLFQLHNWLIVSEWNVDKALKMYLKLMIWRERNEVDRLANEPLTADMLNQFYFHLGGRDKSGCPLLRLPLGDWRTPRSFLEKTKSALVSGDKLRTHFIQMLESVMTFIKGDSTPCSQFVLICDMDAFSSQHFAGAHSFRWFLNTLDQNYPNMMKLAYFINSSASFLKMLEILKPSIKPSIRNKMYLYTDRSNWEPAILQNINMDQLSPRYGGNNYLLS